MTTCKAILKSPNDPKLYRWVTLDNGLTALLIQDLDIKLDDTHDAQGDAHKSPSKAADEEGVEHGGSNSDDDTEGANVAGGDEEVLNGEGVALATNGAKPVALKMAAAALAVGVGSFSDPDDLPGLSHYLEHMLFMGSEQYPDENDYDAYLTANGGSSNAYTELESTNYYFDVNPSHLEGALQRFAAFFAAPLCLETSLEREVKAVDNEFTGVLQNDACRLQQINCHTAEEGHIYRKFTWGNRKSLWELPLAAGTPVRERLLEYYRQHYSAERMSLVVLGGEDLDTQEQRVRALFGGLPHGRGARPSFKEAGMPYKGRSMWVVPAVQEMHVLYLRFLLPPLRDLQPNKPHLYLSQLIGHEGPGSLLTALKDKGWATAVTAGVSGSGFESNSCCSVFSICMVLTDAGLEGGPGFGLGAMELVWQYLQMLREAGPQEWVWKEEQIMSDLAWRFQEEQGAQAYTTGLAASMHLRTPEDVLYYPYNYSHWEPALVTDILDQLHPTSGTYRINLLTNSYSDLLPKLKALPTTHITTEPWFNIEAASMQLPADLLQTWASTPPPPTLHLPPRNNYLPSDFSVRELAEGAVGEEEGREKLAAAMQLPMVLAVPPRMLVDERGLRVWHKLDSVFKLPKAIAAFTVHMGAEEGGRSIRDLVLGALWRMQVDDAFMEEAYLAQQAALDYNMSKEINCIGVGVAGYSHKLPLFTARVFEAITTLKVNPERFALHKEEMLRAYHNANMTAGAHCSYLRLHLLQHGNYHYDQGLAALLPLTAEDVQAFLPKLLASCHLECLLHGNMTEEEARQVATAAHTALGPGCRLPASERPRERCTHLPPGTPTRFRVPAKNPEDKNAAMELYLQCQPPQDVNSYSCAVMSLFSHLVREPSFNTLRTKEQLGYSVYAAPRLTRDVLGFCVAVVSGQYHPRYLEERVEAFLAAFESTLQAMPVEEFLKNRAALLAGMLQKDSSLGDETGRHWNCIVNGRLDFGNAEREAAALERLEMKDVLEFYRLYISPLSPTRRKLAVHVTPLVGPASVYSPYPANSDAPAKGSANEGGEEGGAEVARSTPEEAAGGGNDADVAISAPPEAPACKGALTAPAADADSADKGPADVDADAAVAIANKTPADAEAAAVATAGSGDGGEAEAEGDGENVWDVTDVAAFHLRCGAYERTELAPVSGVEGQ